MFQGPAWERRPVGRGNSKRFFPRGGAEERASLLLYVVCTHRFIPLYRKGENTERSEQTTIGDLPEAGLCFSLFFFSSPNLV